MPTVARFVCEALDIEPPRHDGGADPAAPCWLCGEASGPGAWPLKAILPGTFTQHNLARAPDSGAICAPCAAIINSDVFKATVGKFEIDAKLWSQCGWHSYSHFVSLGRYELPNPLRFRDLLIDPPVPCVAAINTTGKKHTLFRASVMTSAQHLVVQIDEETIRAPMARFRACLADVERLAALGFSKDGIETGRYHPESLRRAGIKAWRAAEAPMPGWRAEYPALLSLTVYVSRSWSWHRDNAADIPPAIKPRIEPTPIAAPAVKAKPVPAQGELF